MFIRKGGFGRSRAGFILALVWILAAGGCSEPKESASPTATPASPNTATAPNTPAAPAKSVTASTTPATKPPPAASAQAPAPAPAAGTLSTVVARTKYDVITIRDLIYYRRTGQCELMANLTPTSMTMPGQARQVVTPVINWIASRQAAAEEVKAKNDPELNAFVTAGLQKNLDKVMFLHTYQSEIKDRLGALTQEDIQAYYDKHKPLYFQPFSFTIRILLLQTYDPYVVQAADVPDKLEAIATQVNGDPKCAALIRADLPGRPLRREPDKMFKPLYAGEKLLIPMSKPRMQEVRSRLEAILKDLKPTSDTQEMDRRFMALAKKYDESGMQGLVPTLLPTGTRQDKPPLTEITRAVIDTPVGQVSKIFQTKHGFQVVEVLDRVASGTLDLSIPVVREDVVTKLTEERHNRANEDLIGTLMDNPNLKIDYRQIASGSRLTTDTVVAALGSTKLFWQDIRDAWRAEGQPVEEGRIRKFLSHNPALATILFRDHFRAQMEDPRTDLGRQIQITRIAYIGTAYLYRMAYVATAKNVEQGKEQARAYFEAHKDDYRSPELLTYAAALWPMNAADTHLKGAELDRAQNEVLRRAQDEMQKVKSADEFNNLKARLDERLVSLGVQPPDTTVPIQFKELKPEYQAILKGVGPGKWTAPALIKADNYVVAFLVKERTADKPKTFEDSIDQVNRDLFNKNKDDSIRKIENDYAQRAGVEFLLQDETMSKVKDELMQGMTPAPAREDTPVLKK